MKARRRSALGLAALVLAVLCALVACGLVVQGTPPGKVLAPLGAAEMPPAEPREFRAAWVASVANIDWPSRPGLDAQSQRREALTMLDRARALGLNAVILQVRPSADALYASALEPWSEYLSGEQGRPPWSGAEPPWDPLAFWVREAHRRGLELHAWINPYRARHSQARSAPVAPHVAVTRPELVRRYGEFLWLDPGEAQAAAHTRSVVLDVVRRYDIDALHIDDYFYPYPVRAAGVELPFPDDGPWARALAAAPLPAGATPAAAAAARADWRRANVNTLVRQLHQDIRATKPWVRLGISPFGLPRPDRRPASVTGFSQYDQLYADVEHWLEQGWLDYLAPQLYWPIDRPGQAFPALLQVWAAANAARPAAAGGPRHLWPGLFTSAVRAAASDPAGPRAWPARELLDQVALLREQRGASGHIHFSMAALMQDRDGVATLLQQGPYAEPALVPSTPWLASQVPAAPRLVREGERLRIEPGDGRPVARYALWRRSDGRWRLAVLGAEERWVELGAADALVASAVDRVGNLSPRTSLRWR